MSIEHGVTSGAPKAAAQGVAGHGRGKTQHGAAPADGFAALLMNLGADELPLEQAFTDLGDDKPAALPGASELLPADGPAAALAADAALAAAALPQATLPAALLAGQVAVPASAGAKAAALPAVAGEVAGATPRAHGGVRAELAAAGGPAQDKAAGEAALTADAGQTAAQPTAELQPLLRQAALVQRMAQQRTQAAEVAAQAVKEQRGEDVAARLGWQASERLEPAGGPLPAWLAAGSAEGGLRPYERRSEKAGHRSGVGEVGGWSAPAPSDAPRLDVPAAAPDAGLMTEMQVAEQVSVWVSRGVQNAELELDGLGEGTVNVNISLQGQEARVEFRADQVQTRQVLEDSMPHLRELLAREGLVLSGMSVGSSGADGAAGRQPQGGRPGSRQTMVAVPELPAAASAAAARTGASGRAVDLFV